MKRVHYFKPREHLSWLTGWVGERRPAEIQEGHESLAFCLS